MSSTSSILRPQITVPLQSGAVVVRDLPWQDALEFLRKLSTHAKDVLAAAIGSDGRVDVASMLPRLTDLIANVADLSTFLITRSTGKDEAWLNGSTTGNGENVVHAGLSTIEAMAILDAALEVNLSDGLIELGKKVAGRLARVMPAVQTTSATLPSPTS